MRDRVRTLVPALAALALAGCTADYREPALPADHPANPAAEIAVLPENPRTLAIVESASPAMPGAHHPAGHDEGVAPPTEPGAIYSCPMHPQVTSDKPDQRCPECGMKLRKQEGGGQP
jgi:hypothetical protein